MYYYEMIELAGIGLAMENAVENFKKVANYVTKGVSAKGRLNALEHYRV